MSENEKLVKDWLDDNIDHMAVACHSGRERRKSLIALLDRVAKDAIKDLDAATLAELVVLRERDTGWERAVPRPVVMTQSASRLTTGIKTRRIGLGAKSLSNCQTSGVRSRHAATAP